MKSRMQVSRCCCVPEDIVVFHDNGVWEWLEDGPTVGPILLTGYIACGRHSPILFDPPTRIHRFNSYHQVRAIGGLPYTHPVTSATLTIRPRDTQQSGTDFVVDVALDNAPNVSSGPSIEAWASVSSVATLSVPYDASYPSTLSYPMDITSEFNTVLAMGLSGGSWRFAVRFITDVASPVNTDIPDPPRSRTLDSLWSPFGTPGSFGIVVVQ